MHSNSHFVAMIAIVAIFPMGWFQTANADPIADFYRGQSARLMISSGFGGGLESYARAFSWNMQMHIPGKPTFVIISKPGGGGTVGAAYMYNAAPRDGSTYTLALFASIL